MNFFILKILEKYVLNGCEFVVVEKLVGNIV